MPDKFRLPALLIFETDDGRTFAGADASILICCFHSFFLKPLSVTLPFAARFTDWGDSEPCKMEHCKQTEDKKSYSKEAACINANAIAIKSSEKATN